MPGNAWRSAPTTRRMDGTADINRKTRRIRNARITERNSVAGTSAMATTTVSKWFQGSRKKSRRCPINLRRISTTKTPRITRSARLSKLPAAAMAAGLVSSARTKAFNTIRIVIERCVLRCSTKSRMRTVGP